VPKTKSETMKLNQFIKILKFSDILNEEDETAVKNGLVSGSERKLLKVAQIERSKIIPIKLDDNVY
jgi:hypothetical protein